MKIEISFMIKCVPKIILYIKCFLFFRFALKKYYICIAKRLLLLTIKFYRFMKTIKPIKFSETEEQNTKATQTHVNRMPPSGSGSGGDVKYGESGGGHGTKISAYGGSWDLDCSFIWTAELTYEKVEGMDVTIVTKATIRINKVQASCDGIPSGTKGIGTVYEPFGLYGIECGSEEFTFNSSCGLTDVDCSMKSSSQVLKVAKTQYDSKGEVVSSSIMEEKVAINIQMTFFVNCYNEKPEIRLVSCDLS